MVGDYSPGRMSKEYSRSADTKLGLAKQTYIVLAGAAAALAAAMTPIYLALHDEVTGPATPTVRTVMID